MKKYFSPIFLLFALLSSAAMYRVFTHIGYNVAPMQQPNLEQLKPEESFFLARLYPTFTLDVAAYAKTIAKTQQTDALQAKNAFTNTPWALEGPQNIGGRINTIAVHPQNPDIILVGCAKGGVFKTTNGGETWLPVFDNQPALAIGHIVFDPVNPDIIYVGTGDPNISITFAVGNGIYKSTDAGNTWTNIGLAEGKIITKIRINPQNPNEIYAGCMGNPFERDANRGLYKTTNGGNTWQKILYADDDAGVIDLVMNPQNPNILYATTWNRIRNNQETFVSGEDAGIWKTTNAGATWTQLTNGLPTGELNRIGLDIYPQNPNTLVAVIVDPNSQLLNISRTDDAGETWYPICTPDVFGGDDPLGSFGWYFGKVNINPYNDQEIYLLGVDLHRTTNNGLSWEQATPPWWEYEVHADKHCLVFTDANTLLLATDGGLYKSTDGSATWTDIENIPNTQFYRIAYNPHQTGIYAGGAQDNGTTAGSSADINNWLRIYGGDGFQIIYHPTNPDVIYAQTQNGNIVVSANGGLSFSGCNTGVDNSDRTNWDTPYIMSANNPDVLYRGTYRVYKNTTGPDENWQPISPDLTDGVIYGDRFHNITCLAESPLNPDFLYAGTSDGNVWRSLNAGTDWENITGTLPEYYVTAVLASPNDAQTVYVTISGYKGSGYLPHVFKSTNNGNTWQDIGSNLPPMGVNHIWVMPNAPADTVIAVATDIGIYATTNAGYTWQRIGSNMPYVSTFDIDYNPQNRRIIAGTFARSMYSFPLDSLLTQPNEEPVGIHNPNVPIYTGQLLAYPIPTRQTLTITLPHSGTAALTLYNLQGQTVFTQALHARQPAQAEAVNLTHLPPGIYLAQLQQGKYLYTQKIVKH